MCAGITRNGKVLITGGQDRCLVFYSLDVNDGVPDKCTV